MTFEDVIYKLRLIANEYRKGVPFSILPEPAKPDFEKFMFGNTVFKNAKGELCAYHHDYVNWLKKIWHKGFEIPMKVNAGFADKA